MSSVFEVSLDADENLSKSLKLRKSVMDLSWSWKSECSRRGIFGLEKPVGHEIAWTPSVSTGFGDGWRIGLRVFKTGWARFLENATVGGLA